MKMGMFATSKKAGERWVASGRWVRSVRPVRGVIVRGFVQTRDNKRVEWEEKRGRREADTDHMS